jgi:zinc and cadmium transporter
MGVFAILIVTVVIGVLISLVGGLILLKSKNHRIADYATALAAGALLAAAFADLLPEAYSEYDADKVGIFVLIGLLVFFVFELAFHYFHHHAHPGVAEPDSAVPMIITGDALHNFIDGIAIAAGFLTSAKAGILIVVIVTLHEIPHQIGDFGFLLKKGLSRRRTLAYNVMSKIATVAAAVLFYFIGAGLNTAPLLALTAGFFIYIAVSDIIPEIHRDADLRRRIVNSIIVVVSAFAIWSLIVWLKTFE